MTFEFDEKKTENTSSAKLVFADPAHRYLLEEIRRLEKIVMEIRKKQEEK